MKIHVYRATGEVPASCRFVAYPFEGPDPMPIRFFASTAGAAEERAATWLRDESEHQARLEDLQGRRRAAIDRVNEQRSRAREAASLPVG